MSTKHSRTQRTTSLGTQAYKRKQT